MEWIAAIVFGYFGVACGALAEEHSAKGDRRQSNVWFLTGLVLVAGSAFLVRGA